MILALAAVLAAASPASPPCAPSALSLRTDAGGGDFNGMSHSGTWLLLTNRGKRACTLPGLPQVTMRDARGRVLPIRRATPVGMHPGPVVRPVTIAPGATVATGLRWVSGEVYDRSRCYQARRIAVAGLTRPLDAHVCGEAGKPATFEQPVLAPRPRS